MTVKTDAQVEQLGAWYQNYGRDIGDSAFLAHENWVWSARVSAWVVIVYEHRARSRIGDSAWMQNQLIVAAHQRLELLAWRLAITRETHRPSSSQPDPSSANHFLGWSLGALEQGSAIARGARPARQ